MADLGFEFREGKHCAARVVGENFKRRVLGTKNDLPQFFFLLGFRSLYFKVFGKIAIFMRGKEENTEISKFMGGRSPLTFRLGERLHTILRPGMQNIGTHYNVGNW